MLEDAKDGASPLIEASAGGDDRADDDDDDSRARMRAFVGIFARLPVELQMLVGQFWLPRPVEVLPSVNMVERAERHIVGAFSAPFVDVITYTVGELLCADSAGSAEDTTAAKDAVASVALRRVLPSVRKYLAKSVAHGDITVAPDHEQRFTLAVRLAGKRALRDKFAAACLAWAADA